jgi:hypothetical protein
MVKYNDKTMSSFLLPQNPLDLLSDVVGHIDKIIQIAG